MTEFVREYRLDTIGTAPRIVTITADSGECTALSTRFGLVSLGQLSATATLVQQGSAITANGHFTAKFIQSCIASAADVPAAISENFTIRFVASLADDDTADEVELMAGDCDDVEHDGQVIDLGEAVAQTLSLALDPFPRSGDAAQRLKEAGVLSEDDVETGPFAGLKGLFNPS